MKSSIVYLSFIVALLITQATMLSRQVNASAPIGNQSKKLLNGLIVQRSVAELGQIRSVAFIGHSFAWAVTLGGDLWRTQDGGQKWKELSSTDERKTVFICISFINSRQGWAVSADAFILNTSDGGENWSKSTRLTYPESGIGIAQIVFTDKLHGWMIGGQYYVWRTVDGGKTWELFTNWKDGICSVRRLKFYDSKNGFLACHYNTIFRTSDGGKNWKVKEIMEGTGVVNDLYFSGQLGWVVGSSSINIHHSSNNGKSWTTQLTRKTRAMADNFESVFFLDSKRGWAAGEKYKPNGEASRGVILQTKNGGKTWAAIKTPDGLTACQWVYFGDTQRGWVVDEFSVYRTINAGKSWEKSWSVVNSARAPR